MVSQDSTPVSLALLLSTHPLPVTAGLSLSGYQRPLPSASWDRSSTNSHACLVQKPGKCLAFRETPATARVRFSWSQLSKLLSHWLPGVLTLPTFLWLKTEKVTQVTHTSARGHGHLLTTVVCRPHLKFIFCKRPLPTMTIPWHGTLRAKNYGPSCSYY